MNRKEFSTFVSSALEEAIEFAEEKAGQKLPRMLAFQWLFRSNQPITDNIVEEIVKHVFIDEEHIYPSVHLGVADLLEDGSLLIVGKVEGSAPRPFGPNQTGRQACCLGRHSTFSDGQRIIFQPQRQPECLRQ